MVAEVSVRGLAGRICEAERAANLYQVVGGWKEDFKVVSRRHLMFRGITSRCQLFLSVKLLRLHGCASGVIRLVSLPSCLTLIPGRLT